MSLYFPDDPGFAEALSARRGEQELDPSLRLFADRFTQTFGVAPLTVTMDSIPQPGSRRLIPQLDILLERSLDLRQFRTSPSGNFDSAKQSLTATLFAASMSHRQLPKRFGLPRWQGRTDWARDVFVYFSEFERTAKSAAHEAVSGKELDGFVAALGLGDSFWCTQRLSKEPTVFVNTDAQASQLRNPDIQRRWGDLYYPLVKRHDEFGYLERAEIFVPVDSRETFDRDFSSNWYYYFK